MENRNPLRVYCKNCGAPAGFDIVRQTYACASCGALTGIQETKEAVFRWRTLQKQSHAVNPAGLTLEEYSCPACGAQIVFERGEASETCDFCGSKLIRKELTEAERMPELIIPFFITPEEARKRMLGWAHEHEDTPEGRSIVSSMGRFQGYYLPYYLIRGPVYGMVTRDGNNRTYRCAGYLEGTVVNLSQQMDNLTLDGITPFDWSTVHPFEYGYIAGHHVKFSDISDTETDSRIREKTAEDFLSEVEKVMQSSGVCVQVETGNISVASALLPVYFIKSGKLTVVMNGQTGRIAVSQNRTKKSNPWVIEPLVYTLLATGLLSIPYHFELEPLFLFAFVFAAIFFSIMGEGRHSLIRRITIRSEAAKAKREKGELKIEEGNDILRNPYDNTPVFYEKNRRGEDVPVRIRFYSPVRILSIIINVVATVLLPLIIAAAVRLIDISGTSQKFSDGFRPMYGAAWYVFAGLIAIIYFAKGVRKDVYEHPILYEATSGKKLGTRASRKLSIFSVLGIQRRNENGKRVSLIKAFQMLGGLGMFLGVFFIFYTSRAKKALTMMMLSQRPASYFFILRITRPTAASFHSHNYESTTIHEFTSGLILPIRFRLRTNFFFVEGLHIITRL